MQLFRVLIGLMVFSLASQTVSSAEFELNDLSGKTHKLSDYRGQWVVVNYWATWCPPCVEEMPELVFFHDKHEAQGDAMVIGVNYESAPESKISEFLDDYLVTYPNLLAEPGSSTPIGPISIMPTTLLIAPDGRLVHKKFGRVDVAYLERTLAMQKKRFAEQNR